MGPPGRRLPAQHRALERSSPEAPIRAGSLRLGVVLHGADRVAGRVGEEDQVAHAADREALHEDRATRLAHAPSRGVDVVDGERALDAERWRLGQEVPALLQRAPHARVVLGPGLDLEEAGRAPGAEPPAEDLLVEPPA